MDISFLSRRATRVVALVAAVGSIGVAGAVYASDHQDTPEVELNPRMDINDVYAFPGSSADRIALIMTTSSRMLVERMLHNSANVMMRQKDEANIPDYPLFTHDEVDRMGKRLNGLPYGHAKHFRGAKDEIEIIRQGAGELVF